MPASAGDGAVGQGRDYPPRPLPFRPRPAAGETVVSYVRRLARANHLRPGYLRRYLRDPANPGQVRLDWLAILSGREQAAVERALTGPHPGPRPRPAARRQGKTALFTEIRQGAEQAGLSVRALADRRGVHRRTIRQALDSPVPAPRRPGPPRTSRLDPHKSVIDDLMRADLDKRPQHRRTVKGIHQWLISQHDATDISYSTVRDYVARRRPFLAPAAGVIPDAPATRQRTGAVRENPQDQGSPGPGVRSRLCTVMGQMPDHAEEGGMRVLVSVDMEGIAGVVDGDDISPGHAEYERNRALLTAEASAAVRGAYACDPDARVLITEAHAAFRNLLPERLDRRAELLRGTPKPWGMMSGLDQDTDAVVFIGYHGKAGTPRSVMAHTISGAVIADVRCNGRSLGELGLNTALAAHFGVPPVLVAGDDTVAAEAADVAPGMRSVVVKHALGARAAAMLHPDEACDRIEQEVPKALADRSSVRPLHFDGPVVLEVEVLRTRMTEHALLIPGTELADGRTLRYAAPDFPTAYQVSELIALLGTL